jgi:hypothetical protein
MTETVTRYLGAVLFIAFTAYGVLGTLRVVRNASTPAGPRPWALFGAFELVGAVQVFGLFLPRPGADLKGGSIVAIAALCFCAYMQRLYFKTSASGHARFPRGPFYIGVVILLAIVVAAHFASPYLP